MNWDTEENITLFRGLCCAHNSTINNAGMSVPNKYHVTFL